MTLRTMSEESGLTRRAARTSPDYSSSAMTDCVPRRRPGSRASEARSGQGRIEIVPIEVALLNQSNLPATLPFLHLKFAQSSLREIIERFEPHEQLASV